MKKLTSVIGVVLAGGRATRMAGRDKGLLQLNGQPLWQHVAQCLQTQVGKVVINANRHLAEYQRSGLPVIADSLADYPGPLAGMLAVMQHYQRQPADYLSAHPNNHQHNTDNWYLFCPCDSPFLPENLAWRLWQQKQQFAALWATSGGRDHPTIVLMNGCLLSPLAAFLQAGERKVLAFLRSVAGQAVEFTDPPPYFINLNTPQQLQQWQIPPLPPASEK